MGDDETIRPGQSFSALHRPTESGLQGYRDWAQQRSTEEDGQEGIIEDCLREARTYGNSYDPRIALNGESGNPYQASATIRSLLSRDRNSQPQNHYSNHSNQKPGPKSQTYLGCNKLLLTPDQTLNQPQKPLVYDPNLSLIEEYYQILLNEVKSHCCEIRGLLEKDIPLPESVREFIGVRIAKLEDLGTMFEEGLVDMKEILLETTVQLKDNQLVIRDLSKEVEAMRREEYWGLYEIYEEKVRGLEYELEDMRKDGAQEVIEGLERITLACQQSLRDSQTGLKTSSKPEEGGYGKPEEVSFSPELIETHESVKKIQYLLRRISKQDKDIKQLKKVVIDRDQIYRQLKTYEFVNKKYQNKLCEVVKNQRNLQKSNTSNQRKFSKT